MSHSVYLAAALTESLRMRKWGELFEREGLAITSSWIFSDDTVDPHSRAVRRQILFANLRDLQRADVLFADTTAGQPACTFAEIGYALALGKHVVWFQPEGRRADGVRAACLIDAHDHVTVVHNEAAAVAALREVGT